MTREVDRILSASFGLKYKRPPLDDGARGMGTLVPAGADSAKRARKGKCYHDSTAGGSEATVMASADGNVSKMWESECPLPELPHCLDRLQQFVNDDGSTDLRCRLQLAEQREHMMNSVVPVLTEKGTLKQQSGSAVGVHVHLGDVAALEWRHYCGVRSKGAIFRVVLKCNCIARNCATTGPFACSFRVEAFIPRPEMTAEEQKRDASARKKAFRRHLRNVSMQQQRQGSDIVEAFDDTTGEDDVVVATDGPLLSPRLSSTTSGSTERAARGARALDSSLDVPSFGYIEYRPADVFVRCRVMYYGRHSPNALFNSSWTFAGFALRSDTAHQARNGTLCVRAPSEVFRSRIAASKTVAFAESESASNDMTMNENGDALQLLDHATAPLLSGSLAFFQRAKKRAMSQKLSDDLADWETGSTHLDAVRNHLAKAQQIVYWKDPMISEDGKAALKHTPGVPSQSQINSDSSNCTTEMPIAAHETFVCVGVRAPKQLFCDLLPHTAFGIYVDGNGKRSAARYNEFVFLVRPRVRNLATQGEVAETKARPLYIFVCSKSTLAAWNDVLQRVRADLLEHGAQLPPFFVLDKDEECARALRQNFPASSIHICAWHAQWAVSRALDDRFGRRSRVRDGVFLFFKDAMNSCVPESAMEKMQLLSDVEKMKSGLATLLPGESVEDTVVNSTVKYFRTQWLCELWKSSWQEAFRPPAARRTNITAESFWRWEQAGEYQNRNRRPIWEHIKISGEVLTHAAEQHRSCMVHGFPLPEKTREERRDEHNMNFGVLLYHLCRGTVNTSADSVGKWLRTKYFFHVTTSGTPSTLGEGAPSSPMEFCVHSFVQDAASPDSQSVQEPLPVYECSCEYFVHTGRVCAHIMVARLHAKDDDVRQAVQPIEAGALREILAERQHRQNVDDNPSRPLSHIHSLLASHQLSARNVPSVAHLAGKRGPKTGKAMDLFPLVQVGTGSTLPEDALFLGMNVRRQCVLAFVDRETGTVRRVEEVPLSTVNARDTVAHHTRDVISFIGSLLDTFFEAPDRPALHNASDIHIADAPPAGPRETLPDRELFFSACDRLLHQSHTTYQLLSFRSPSFMTRKDNWVLENLCCLVSSAYSIVMIVACSDRMRDVVAASEQRGDVMLMSACERLSVSDTFLFATRWMEHLVEHALSASASFRNKVADQLSKGFYAQPAQDSARVGDFGFFNDDDAFWSVFSSGGSTIFGCPHTDNIRTEAVVCHPNGSEFLTVAPTDECMAMDSTAIRRSMTQRYVTECCEGARAEGRTCPLMVIDTSPICNNVRMLRVMQVVLRRQ